MDHDTSIALMKWLSAQTKRMGIAQDVYVVGGAVRNFVLDQPIKDIDMVVDSLSLGRNRDAEWLAQQLARRIPAQTDILTSSLRVSTIKIKGSWVLDGYEMEGNDIDIADARAEVYEVDPATGEYVGHKPLSVSPTTMEDDVSRREFTFNTLLWRLMDLSQGPDKAEIIDLTGCGVQDLNNREMRCPGDPDDIFAQDPTRIIRTIKFAFKYGMKLPPDVKAAAKRQAKGLKRIPSKAWTVLQTIVFDNPQYKKALNVMEDLGVTDVLAEMMQSNKQFATTLGKYSHKRGLAYMFDLMDVGIPVGAPMKFLDAAQQKRMREITTGMERDDALEFLETLKNPGRAYDKKFIPTLAMSLGYKGSQMRDFMGYATPIGREALLSDPSLMDNPSALMRQVEQGAKQAVPTRVAMRWASENEPTNPKLWAKVQALAKGEQASMTLGGKTVNGPNEGKGFTVFPSAYANGWASKTYGDLGGGWKKKARGKAKKDVGHGGLDEWFSGHGGEKGKGEDATWGDWVSISPVTKTLPSGKKVEKGDIVGDCGISDAADWKEITKGGKDPLKCMPRQKAHDMPKKERAEKAKAKQKAERADSNRGKKPTLTPTFDKKADRVRRIQMKREAASRLRSEWRGNRG
jgi:tRNA nucleotidyltransferase/poly(A) polymerase